MVLDEVSPPLNTTIVCFLQENALPSDTILLSVKITNTGKYDGDEVVQVYSAGQHGGMIQPVKELIAFQRVPLQKGETKRISIPIAIRQLRYYDIEQKDYRVMPGIHTLLIGADSEDIRLKKEIRILDQ